MTWGQFIRWADPQVEENHYHQHTGDWPNPSTDASGCSGRRRRRTSSDLDGDGKNEVIGVPNVEMHEPYETQAYAVMVLEGAHGDGSRSAMRKPGWETLPRGGAPMLRRRLTTRRAACPRRRPSTSKATPSPEIVGLARTTASCTPSTPRASELWRFNYTLGKAIMYASEPVIADLNQDGSPEVLFTTFGDPDVLDSGHLVILGADGTLLHDVPLPNPGHNGNGNGAPAAPAVGDLDGDGVLEIFVQTFEHGMDVFKVPGSATNCLLWATARGGPLRMGQPNGA